LCFKEAEGQVPDVGCRGWVLGFLFVWFCFGFFLPLNSDLQVRPLARSHNHQPATGQLPTEKRNNESEKFLG